MNLSEFLQQDVYTTVVLSYIIILLLSHHILIATAAIHILFLYYTLYINDVI